MSRRVVLLMLGAACLAGALAVATEALAQAIFTREVLVLASASTLMPRTTGSSAFELQNNGANRIWCGLGVDAGVAVVGKSRRVDPGGGTWAVDAPYTLKTWCKAETADQVTGSATVLSEVSP